MNPQQTPPNYNAPDLGPDTQTAADVIREKLARIYGEEPNAVQEMQEADHSPHPSKHQQFMHGLSTSGKDLASIQTEWHNYYQQLPEDEKHAVWKEFYASQSLITNEGAPTAPVKNPHTLAEHKHEASRPKKVSLRDARSTKDIKEAIRHTATAGGKLERKHHIQSLLFGLSMGFIVMVIFLFGFFNEVFIAPFIQPGRAAADTPLIVNSNSVAPSATPEVIIPKINVQIPTDFSQKTIDDKAIEAGLDNGVVHYPTTALPGQNGNGAYFGHSSNNIFNKGKYKFAFVMLRTLVPGDTFYLTYNGKVYVYKVISKTVVEPTQVSVLDPIPGKVATATLITCDPPGTSLKRLVVVGEQISPDPTGNTAAAATSDSSSEDSSPTSLPGNGLTAWGRFIRTPVGKTISALVLFAAFFFIARWMTAPARQQASAGKA